MKTNLKILTKTKPRTKVLAVLGLALLVTVSCMKSGGLPKGDADNGGLFLPGGFEAVVVHDSVGRARHLAVNEKGEIYVKLRVPIDGKGIVVLKDNDNDGKADVVDYFGDYPDTGNYGTSMRLHKGYLYFTTAGEVYRTKMTPGKMIPEGKVELLVTDDYKNDPHGSSHIAKPLAFDNDGNMYVPFGSPSDVCGIHDRQPGSLGQDPCPELVEHAGIWKFSDSIPNQTLKKDGVRYATGIRSVVAMDWNQFDNTLYVVQHGRDDLVRQFPDLYNPWQSALLPSEEFFRVPEGTDGGWPYYYFDFMQGKKLRNPEYGGDGKIGLEPDSKVTMPLIGFPGHFAPNDLLFYTGDQFPERYKNGAFIAFHGSTIRSPYPQGGYFIGFVPFKDGKPSGDWEVFADGFSGRDTIINTSDAAYRPMGLAMGPDGSLYLSESEKGKIWRVMFKGDKAKFGEADLAGMQKRKETQPNIKTPDIIKDNVNTSKIAAGGKLYNTYCATCHQTNGKGDGTRFPPLENSEYVKGDKGRLIDIVLNGLNGPIKVNGVGFNEVMPANSYLSDEQISLILTYVRANFKNNLTGIQPGEIAIVREQTKKP